MNKELYNRKIRVPEKILSQLKTNFDSIKSDANLEGHNRNIEIREKGFVTYQTLKRWKNWFDSNTEDNNSFLLNGGEVSKNWVDNTLNSLRQDVNQSKKNKKYGEGNLDVNVQVVEQIDRINKLINL
jgi:hypothetical protein